MGVIVESQRIVLSVIGVLSMYCTTPIVGSEAGYAATAGSEVTPLRSLRPGAGCQWLGGRGAALRRGVTSLPPVGWGVAP